MSTAGSGVTNPNAPATTATFTTSLVTNMVTGGVQLALFIALRAFLKAVYEPRTYIPPKERQASVLGRHVLKPLWTILRADSSEILHRNGVDPYVFVRFLHMMSKGLLPIWLLSWAVLLPLNSANMDTGRTGLDQFTSGNITQGQSNRYWAHLVLDYVFVFWLLYLMWKEMQHWLVIRQKFLVDEQHSKLPQANTVLVQGIPQDLLDEERLEKLFAHLPGGVKRIWLNRDLKDLPGYYDRRENATAKLESAQVSLIKFASKYRSKRQHQLDKLEHQHKSVPDSLAKPINADMLAPYKATNAGAAPNPSGETTATAETCGSGSGNGRDGGEDGQPALLSPDDLGRADQLVPRDKRPFFRQKPRWAPFSLGWLGIGKRIDTIDWARNEIAECSAVLAEGREQLRLDAESPGFEDDRYPPLNSAFIYFHQQIAAHMAEQILLHHRPYKMSRAYIEQSPENVIWFNLNLGAYQLSLRHAASIAVTIGFIIIWAFPVTFIGLLANVTALVERYPWMGWLAGNSGAKRVLQGVVTGVLPPILLQLLNLALPALLRLIATFQGLPTKKAVELDLMTRYFIFLVVHNFFVVTISGGILNAIPELLADPISVPVVLSNEMPNSSTFFITLILTQFTGTMGTLLQPFTLGLYYLRVILGGGTPRSVYNSRYRLSRLGWGQQFPAVTVYAVIMLAYMVISPLITGFGACFFIISGAVFKYLFIWVIDQPVHEDTGGLFFPKAITQVFVGMYIQQVALCAFFFIQRDEGLYASAIPQGALMVVLIVITAAVHYTIVQSYGPLVGPLPLTLAHLSHGMAKDGQPSAAMIEDDAEEDATTRGSGSSPVKGSSKRSRSMASHADAPLINEKAGAVSRPSDDRPVVPSRRASQMGVDDSGATRTQAQEVDDTPAIPTAPGPPRDSASVHSRSRQSEPGLVPPMEGEAHELATFSPSSLPSPSPSPSPRSGDADANPDSGNTTSGSQTPALALSQSKAERGMGPADSPAEETTNPFFAVPGGPGVRPRFRHIGGPGDASAFLHPASKNPQRVVWLPRDGLQLCEAEVRKNRECGVQSSWRHAELTVDGKVHISGRPPDDDVRW